MASVAWRAASDGRYWIDIDIGGMGLRCMVDLGIVDRLNRYGFELAPSIYDQLRLAGRLSSFESRGRRDASGRKFRVESGLAVAQLVDPANQQRVGPKVAIYAGRGAVGVPSRVGLVFFHRLKGCSLDWDFDGRIWSILIP